MTDRSKRGRQAKPPLTERARSARDAFGFTERPALSRPKPATLPRRVSTLGRPADKAAVGLMVGAGSLAGGGAATRRTLVGGAAGLVAIAALAKQASGAQAAVSTSPQTPTVEQVQMRRLSFGLTPALTAEVAAAGGVAGWIKEQLDGVPDPDGDVVDSWFPYVNASPTDVFNAVNQDFSNAFRVSWTRSGRFLMRALYSRRQLFERTVDFFSNYQLNVPTLGGDSYLGQPDLDRIIRKHAWGTFEELLTAVVTSPAMMLYLDGYSSTASALNENLGRELLELHTVGKGAGYTEAMVRDSARLLTGYCWDGYNPSAHYIGPVQVLGFTSVNTDSDGRAAVQSYLKYLANHPATATRLATRLIQYFCTDSPSSSYVDAVATAYRNSGTDLKATLRAVFAHSDFGTTGRKLASPLETLLASWRLRGLKAVPPTWKLGGDGWFDFATCSPAIAQWWAKDVGQEPLAWQTPDGYPVESTFWDQANSHLALWNCHWTTASRTPNVVGFTAPDFDATFGISSPITFSDAVNRIADRVWGRPADAQLMTASAEFFGVADTGATITDADWIYQSLSFVVQFALNHPLAVTR
ncbi:MAG TPA: DUF1800 domain-containing protein [Aeromicrobium sp.]|nr:DUF1800 domain-containing protein [Aeromicrobium sp.]